MILPNHRLPEPIGELKGNEAVTWCEIQLETIRAFDTQLPDSLFKTYFLIRRHDNLEMIEESACHIREGGLDTTGQRWLWVAEDCTWEMRLLMSIFNHLRDTRILKTRVDMWWREHGCDSMVQALAEECIYAHGSDMGGIIKELSESSTPVPDDVVRSLNVRVCDLWDR